MVELIGIVTMSALVWVLLWSLGGESDAERRRHASMAGLPVATRGQTRCRRSARPEIKVCGSTVRSADGLLQISMLAGWRVQESGSIAPGLTARKQHALASAPRDQPVQR